MLRHVCASWLGQMSCVGALTIRDLLGHSSVTMTDRYMHGDQADLHDAVHKLENFRSHSGHSEGVVPSLVQCIHRKRLVRRPFTE